MEIASRSINARSKLTLPLPTGTFLKPGSFSSHEAHDVGGSLSRSFGPGGMQQLGKCAWPFSIPVQYGDFAATGKPNPKPERCVHDAGTHYDRGIREQQQ